ncbi:MAG: hypothetical protein ACM3VV_08290 [Deltaproteobacteria bacterium]
MSEYNDLLQELRSKIIDLQKPIIATAKEYIPKMYKAILNENPNLTPIEAREKIEKDCREELWSKRTIIAALPDEAKNLEKQKAGRQRHKNKNENAAAMIAAPNNLKPKVILDVNRTGSSSTEIEDLINENYELKQIIQKNTEIKTADNIITNNNIFKIPKEKLPLLVEVITKSKEYCYLEFDKEKVLVSIQSDIVEENYKC